jgi:NAD(P)-dependent dehydrogenase (short-subunit alcohol dehydrogenase family)
MRVAITGCNRGIGRAVSSALAEDGASLLVHVRRQEDLDAVVERLRGLGAQTVAGVVGDLRDQSLGERLAAAAFDGLGGLDAILLNAAILGPMGPVAELERHALRQALDIGVVAQVDLIRPLLPRLVAQGHGAILWMSSALGRIGLPGYGAYAAMKHAVEGLAKVVAEEHKDDGLISLAIAPGLVQTEMLQAALGTDDVSEFQTPEATAQGFVRLLHALEPSMNGASLDIEPWLP